jgi:15-cis-phytoene synthase
VIREGYARCREVTRAHAKSFYWASFALFGARRRAAFALYAFCRRLDDVVDEEHLIRSTLPLAAHRVREQLAEARAVLLGADPAGTWLHPAEVAALRDTLSRFHIPIEPFLELIAGMEMDLAGTRYRTAGELDLYCHRVAGVVGLMLFPVLGGGPEASAQAAELGRAMQLTNILRDVREDLARGRLYLPEETLAAHGLSAADVERGVTDARWAALMRSQISRAREGYRRALPGVRFLTAFGAATAVRLMAALYAGILDAIEARAFDVFSGRAFVPFRTKLSIATRVLLRGEA